MAWTKIVEEDNRRFNNELLTYNSAIQLFKELESKSFFYETEPAAALGVGNIFLNFDIWISHFQN